MSMPTTPLLWYFSAFSTSISLRWMSERPVQAYYYPRLTGYSTRPVHPRPAAIVIWSRSLSLTVPFHRVEPYLDRVMSSSGRTPLSSRKSTSRPQGARLDQLRPMKQREIVIERLDLLGSTVLVSTKPSSPWWEPYPCACAISHMTAVTTEPLWTCSSASSVSGPRILAAHLSLRLLSLVIRLEISPSRDASVPVRGHRVNELTTRTYLRPHRPLVPERPGDPVVADVGEGLPDLVVELSSRITCSTIASRPADADLLGSDLPMTRGRGRGTGCRLRDLRREAEERAQRPHLVLVELPEGLDELQLQVLGEAADVVVRLDHRSGRGSSGRSLSRPGRESLGEVPERPFFPRVLLELLREDLPDDLPLLLWV